ncbi:MAG: CotH kinase family protein [Akkermansiaceae bacterium]
MLVPLQGAEVVISEFMASNISGITDEDGDDSDWIELTNISGGVVDLSGWSLTDDPLEPNQWIFPEVILGPGDELLIFASGKDRAISGAEFHTNFKLSTSGEFLGLIRPDGVTLESSYAPTYPRQYPDVSYGLGSPSGTVVPLVGADSPLKYHVPADASVDVGGADPFHEWEFDDSTWTEANMGVGYAVTTNTDPYDSFIGVGGDLQSDLYQQNSTVYLRVPFNIDDPSAVTALNFGARYDDGFALYINGSPILVSANAPSDGVWDFEAAAGGSHSDSLAVALEEFSINLGQVELLAGENILAVHALNRTAGNSDFLFDCELSAVVTQTGVQTEVYMTSPTPGSANAGGVTDLGPVINEVTENPARPDLSLQTILPVTARVVPSSSAVEQVTLFYRVGFGAESSLIMNDDGVSPDVSAGDGMFSANIPLAGLSDGEMIRWRVEAKDEAGTTSREPLFFDPLNSPEYFGTAAIDPALDSDLPVLEWFIANPSAANNRAGTRVAVLHLGEFYDNVFCRVRGGSSAGLNKKSYKFDFNTGHHFKVAGEANTERVEELNLNTTWTDKSYVRQPLTYQFYDLAGSPGPECFLMRVEQNGTFFSVAAYTEQVDERLLRREKGIDDDGALYKMFNGGTSSTSGVEKKNRRHEDNSDLAAYVSGLNQTGTALENFIFDNIDLPRQLNYLAATVLTQNNDNMKKNYYLYRDTERSGEWTQIAWDTDLTWGSHYMTNDNISHDGIWATADYVLGGRNANAPISPSHPFVGIRELPGNRSWSKIVDKLLENDRFQNMFRRRLQTLVDEALLTSEAEDRIALMEMALGNDAVLDKNKWGQFGLQQSLSEAVGVLKDDYLIPRRTHLSVTHLASNSASYPTPQTSSALLPGPQSSTPNLVFGDVEGSPASGNQAEEFLEIVNQGVEAIDLSEWSLDGGVKFDLLPGTIVEAGGSLYLSSEVAAFRARASSPRGGEGLNVEGDYDGQISARGETITLLNREGLVVTSVITPDVSSDWQKYLRITEMHFAPLEGKEFEFIELRNIGPNTLDLTGVVFTDGVEALLSGSLAPGEYGLVVANPANFAGLKIVGTYTGALNNGGEQVTLRDPSGENILSFDYDGDWFPSVRNLGYSLVFGDVSADWSAWDDQFAWAISSEVGGSPAVDNPEPFSNDYYLWNRLYFSAGELTDPAISGPAADGNGDGVDNLVSYALGLNPVANVSSGLPGVEVDGEVVSMTFDRLLMTPDITLSVRVSEDLKNWTTEADLVSSIPNGDGTARVTFQSPIPRSSGNAQFLRIQVSR